MEEDTFGQAGFWVATVVIIIIALTALVYLHGEKKKAQRRVVARAYKRALDFLAQHPTDPQARLLCLEYGRLYYAVEIPDTFTLVVGRNVFGTQDYQNNTAGREARIAADIEARVGHLKLTVGS